MREFIHFVIENMFATVVAIISAVAGIVEIVNFIKKPNDNKKKLVLGVIGVIFSAAFIYLVFQYVSMDKTETKENYLPSTEDVITTESESQSESEKTSESEEPESAGTINITIGPDNKGSFIIDGDNNTIENKPVEEPKVEIPVTVSSVNLNMTDLNMAVGESEQIKATVLYSDNSQNNTVVWVSSNEEIATVDSNGVVEAHSIGEVEIIAQASRENTSKEARCRIKVMERLTGYDISISTTQAYLNETFFVYVTPYEENTEITLYGKAPSGDIYEMARDVNDAYHIYAELGIWTIYAQIKNGVDVYDAHKPEDYVTIEIVPLESMHP